MSEYSAVWCPGCKGTGLTRVPDIPPEIERAGSRVVSDYICDPNTLVGMKFDKCKRCDGKGFIAVKIEELKKE